MPFGLCNVPATFQRLMDLVLAGLQWADCLVYVDDVIIMGWSYGEHLSNLRVRQAGLKLKPKKCVFSQRMVSCLGHVLREDSVTLTHTLKIRSHNDGGQVTEQWRI